MKAIKFVARAVALASLAASGTAFAAFPDKPVTIVVPYPAGGATDVIARLIAEQLPAKWNQPVVVRNQPGAGTTVAAEAVSREKGDGYTLYMTTAAHTISASLYKNLRYDPIKDFKPITLVSTIPLVLVTPPSLEPKNLNELVSAVKASKEGMTIASTGNGTPQHLTGELFKSKQNLNLVHIPYRGDAPMITDLLGGQVQMAFVTLSAAVANIQAGKLKPIALAHSKRVDAIADVPTFAEAGMPDFEAATWFGLFAPASIPDDLRQKIYKDVSEIVAKPEITQRLVSMGGEVNNSSPEQFQAFIDKEAKNWAEAVKISGASVD